VVFAEDGLQALELARELHPAVVITEILVPKMDGLALCQRVKSAAPLRNTVVVVLSLLAAEGRAREAGADAFLSKPLLPEKLTATVRALMNPRSPASRGAFPSPAPEPSP
jgi:two-component system response regulator MprA